MANVITKGQVSLKEKIGYGLSEAGAQFSWTFLGTFLSIYYTDVVGLTPAVISVIMLVARIWDAINDPMFGIIADKTKSKWGRYRPYLLFGTPLLAFFQILTFMNLDISQTAKGIWSCVTYILCGMAYTAVSISTASLGSVMTTDSNERVTLMSFRGILATIAGVIINAIAMPMILYFGNNGENQSQGYLMAAVVFSVLAIPCLWIAFATTKERVTAVGVNTQKHSIGQILKVIISNRNVLCLLIGQLLCLTGIFGRLGVMTYYYIYVLGRPDLTAVLCTLLTLAMVIPNFVCPPLMKVLNKKVVVSIGCAIGVIGCVILYVGGVGSIPCAFIGTFLLGASSWGTICNFGIGADIVDEIEVKNGVRNDGIIFSAVSFSTKLGNAIGGSVGVALLAVVGYVPNAQQTAETIQGMNAIINLGPGLMLLLSIIPYMLLTINNKQSAENTRILEEKRKNA